MPLYELWDGTSHRFWRIRLSGRTLSRRWSGDGQRTRSDVFSSADASEARAQRDGYIAEQLKQGYVLAEGEEPPCEDGEDTSGTARRNLELEAAIEKDPDNIAGYLVYGDWLQGQEDPRGELIALQCAAHQASGEQATQLELQALALMREHKRFLLGELADREEYGLLLEWRFGFIRSAQLHFGPARGVAQEVRALRALPTARFLRELTLGALDFELDEDGHSTDIMDYGGIIAALSETPWPTLERLFIGDFYANHANPDDVDLRDVSPLYKALPGLRALKLRGGWDLALGEMELPELREFTAQPFRLPPEAVQSIVKAKWPKLERLEVWFGEKCYGAGGDEMDLQPLLDGQGLPNLKHLGLCNASFMHALSASLPGARILPQLQSLDLSQGTLTDEDAAMLARHAAAFRHLKHLNVRGNPLTGEGDKHLATLCESLTTDNRIGPYRTLGSGVAAVEERAKED